MSILTNIFQRGWNHQLDPYLDVIFCWRFASRNQTNCKLKFFGWGWFFLPVDVSSLGCNPHLEAMKFGHLEGVPHSLGDKNDHHGS